MSPLNMNCIKKLHLSFTSTLARKEYEALCRSQFVKFLRIFLFLMAVYGTYAMICYFIAKDLFGAYVMIGWTTSLLLLWKFCKKVQKCVSILVIILFVPIFIPGLIRLYNSIEPSPVMFYPFFAGYFLGFFERIVTLRLPGFFYKSVYTVAGYVTRVAIFGKMMLPFLLSHTFIITIGLILDFFRVREDQKIFQIFYDYREELIKFRTLMVSGIPSKILILSQDLKQKLFLNERFQLILDQQTSPKEEINERIQDFLQKIHIERNTLDQATKALIDSHCQKDHSLSTFQFLQTLTEKSLLSDQTQKIIFDTSLHQENLLERKVLEVTVFSLLWDGQDALAIILNDVTVQHQNLALKIADANKDKMLALISHELRTPLNGILGVVQLLEKNTNDIQTLQHLKVCKASGQLLLNLVNSILDLQHIRDNKFSLKVTQVHLSELLHDVYDLFKFQFEQKGLKLTLNIDPELSKNFSTDQNRLKQILINLIGNALKFTFEGGVEITATKNPTGYIEFRVSDTGTGIKEEDQDKLFKMYGRLDQENPQANTQGIGFGLEISNQLAKLLCEGEDGGIKFESEVGKGTSFYFLIKEITVDHSSEILIKPKPKIQKKSSKNEIQDQIIDVEEFNYDESLSLPEKPNDLSQKMTAYSLQTFSKTHIESTVHKNKTLAISKTPSSQPLLVPSISTISKGPIETEGQDLDIQYTGSSEAMSFCKKAKKFFRQEKTPKKLRILLVDDNPFNLLIAKHLAENLGYETNSALNGKIAIEMLQNQQDDPYCLVLMDLQMPVMDGYEATKILKKMMDNGEIEEIPIIALSANDSPDDKRRCKEIGMKDHIPKPLDENRLKKVLEEVIEDNDDSSHDSEIQLTDPK